MKLIITDVKDFKNSVLGEHKIIKPEGNVKHCIGCFGCWTKTPGECVIKDGYSLTGALMGKSDELIMISECLYGGFSEFVKKVQDRAISYVRGDFNIIDNEMRHRQRYFNKLKVTAIFYGEDLTEGEKITARKIVEANAKNFYAKVEKVLFYRNAAEIAEVTL